MKLLSMEYKAYDFCTMTDPEEDPLSDYDFCYSTDNEQGPCTDSDNDLFGNVDLDMQDNVDETVQASIQICQNGSILHPTLDLYAIENRNLRVYMVLEDVIKEHALSFLPAKSLLRFKTVCKKWNRWISSPFLAHKQSNNFRDVSGLIYQLPDCDPCFISLNPRAYGIPNPSFRFLPDEVDIRTSCGGLICCQGRSGDDTYYVCNPANKEWKKLPKPTYYHGSEPAIVLAFEPSLVNFDANYELVCAFQLSNDLVCFEIYSSKTNMWRVSETVWSELEEVSAPKSGGFFMKGYVYWETLSGSVLAFNLKDETLGVLELPPTSGSHGILTEMHGEIFYILPKKEDDGILIIEMYGNVNMSLQQMIHINLDIVGGMGVPGEVRALTCINGDTLIFAVGNEVIAYHVKADEVEFLYHVWDAVVSKYLPYVNSLVSVAPEA